MINSIGERLATTTARLAGLISLQTIVVTQFSFLALAFEPPKPHGLQAIESGRSAARLGSPPPPDGCAAEEEVAYWLEAKKKLPVRRYDSPGFVGYFGMLGHYQSGATVPSSFLQLATSRPNCDATVKAFLVAWAAKGFDLTERHRVLTGAGLAPAVVDKLGRQLWVNRLFPMKRQEPKTTRAAVAFWLDHVRQEHGTERYVATSVASAQLALLGTAAHPFMKAYLRDNLDASRAGDELIEVVSRSLWGVADNRFFDGLEGVFKRRRSESDFKWFRRMSYPIKYRPFDREQFILRGTAAGGVARQLGYDVGKVLRKGCPRPPN